MAGETVVITKSTVPVGTANLVRAKIREFSSAPVHVCSNPEFLKEGAAVDDFMKPDRVVVGVDSEHARNVLEQLYAPFVRTGNPVIFMDIASAEITKYAANAMLATRISFMNSIAALCDRVGADVTHVRKGVGSDPRIGPYFLFAGCGYGGSCFPKDVKALIRTFHENAVDAGILEAVERVNEGQKHWVLERVDDRFPDGLAGRTIACGAWRSSRRRTTCGKRRRSSWSRACSGAAPPCAFTIPRRSSRPVARSATASPTAPTTMRSSRAPMRS
jgi:UDPglucose 6-dehydrogenase